MTQAERVIEETIRDNIQAELEAKGIEVYGYSIWNECGIDEVEC